jgi:ATP-binding cassette subfamily B protein
VTLTAVLWWAAVPLAVAWLLAGAALGRGFARQLTGLRQRTEDLRRAAYVRGVALGLAEAKEVRVFGLGEWLRGRYSDAWTAGMAELFRRRPAAAVRTAGLVVVLACAYVAVVGTLAAQAADGTLTVAALTVGVQAAVGMASFGWVSDAQWQLAAAAAALPAATGLRTVAGEPAERQATTRSRPATDESRESRTRAPDIRFSAVRFGYPGRPAPAVDGLDLRLPAGRTLGVVGDNGAGKSTIVRLLCRLHDPDHGTITADGVDLRHVDPAAWRRRLAVVFQDFVRYELSARDNVVFGQADMSDDVTDDVTADVTDDELWAVAEAAGAEDVIHALPHGWDTVLSRRFGTTDLSGGQWQRIAFARALFAVGRGASVLVLDEPTAHLDAMAEAALYERFLELTEGLTTVLVSHRFNTVRLADRIAVVRGGTVAEYGDHDTLMAVDGWYARSFRLQADRLGATE